MVHQKKDICIFWVLGKLKGRAHPAISGLKCFLNQYLNDYIVFDDINLTPEFRKPKKIITIGFETRIKTINYIGNNKFTFETVDKLPNNYNPNDIINIIGFSVVFIAPEEEEEVEKEAEKEEEEEVEKKLTNRRFLSQPIVKHTRWFVHLSK